MKTLVISDIHLTHRFDERKYRFLEKLFSSYDAIILNGDFWDGFSTTIDRFVKSEWSKLFPLLKAKGAIYLFGNHDKREFNDERMSLFSVENKDSHEMTEGIYTYHFEHGHILCPAFDALPLPRFLMKYVNFMTFHTEKILVKLGSPHNIITRSANRKIKKRLKNLQFPHWYLCGHTHVAEFDNTNKFANSGFVQYGKATYLIIDPLGPSLQTEWYR
jgi:predicted phosphodiesterase